MINIQISGNPEIFIHVEVVREYHILKFKTAWTYVLRDENVNFMRKDDTIAHLNGVTKRSATFVAFFA